MKPNRSNYEIWFIDYIDGNLNIKDVDQLISFLGGNPDLKEEFDEISNYRIEPENNIFPNKLLLKKSVSDLSEQQFEYLCISASENDLSVQQREELNLILKKVPGKKKIFDLYQNLKLTSPSVCFNRKSHLRKLTLNQKIISFGSIAISVAACIAIMIAVINQTPDVKNAAKNSPITLSIVAPDENKTTPNITAVNSNQGEKQEHKNGDNEKGLSTLSKPDSLQISAPSGELIRNDSPGARETESGISEVSKINFRQEVNLGKSEFNNSLVALNSRVMANTETPEVSRFNNFIAKTFRERIYKSDSPETGSLKFHEVADAGINGLNKLFGWQMSLIETRDQKGDIKSVNFSSKLLKFNAPVRKTQLGS